MQTAALELILKLKDQASQGLQAIRNALGGVGERARSVAGNLATFLGGTAVAGTLAFGGAIAGAGVAGLSFNNSMEMVTAQLNAFTKDGAKSAEILAMIKDRASRTPFEFEQMAQAATALLPASKASGVALEELIAKAEILAASNPAEGLEGAAFSLKEALSGDFTSIIERFNLPRQRLNELKEQGVPALEAVQIAMQELGLDADLVGNLANTASGRWSTLKDTFTGLASTVTQPIFERVSAGLAGLNDWITANQPMLDAFAATLADRVGGAVDFLATNAIPALVRGWQAVQPAVQLVSDRLNSLMSGGIGPLSGVLDTLVSAIQPVIAAFEERGLAGAAGAALFQIGELRIKAVELLGAALPGIIAQLQQWGMALLGWIAEHGPGMLRQLGAQTGRLLDAIGAALPGIVEALAAWGAALVQWVTDNGPGLLRELGSMLADVLAWIVERVPGIAAQLGEWALAFLGWVGPAAGDLILALGGLLGEVFTWIADGAPGLMDTLSSWTQTFVDWATTKLGPALLEALKGLGGKIWGEVTSLWSDAFAPGTRGEALLNGLGLGGAPQVPGFARGVSNFGGGLAYVHAGELLVNMPRGTDVIPAPQAGRMLGGRGSMAGGEGGGITWTGDLIVQGSVVTERDLIDRIQKGLIEKGRRTNGDPLRERT